MFSAMEGVFVAILFYLLLGYNGVQGYQSLLGESNFELEKQLELFNKPTMKTIKVAKEGLYDCVDFYKQPSFDHPLLMNHTFNVQMKPQFVTRKNDAVSFDTIKTLNIGLKGGGCPTGTVPIKRSTKNDLIRDKLVAERSQVGGVHYAVVQAQSNKFTGAEGLISIYAPRAVGKEYSAARMKIQNGINGTEFIAFGWRVDQTLYGNTRSHLYIQTNTDSTKCFDARCGFVVTAKDVAPGMVFEDVSIPGKITLVVHLSVKRRRNWWLGIGSGSNATQMGFWPHKLFKDLSDFGTFVDWGGEVYSPPDIQSPPMGSSSRPVKDTRYDAFVANILAVDINGKSYDPATVTFNDDRLDYNVIDVKNAGSFFKHLVLFGGSFGEQTKP